MKVPSRRAFLGALVAAPLLPLLPKLAASKVVFMKGQQPGPTTLDSYGVSFTLKATDLAGPEAAEMGARLAKFDTKCAWDLLASGNYELGDRIENEGLAYEVVAVTIGGAE